MSRMSEYSDKDILEIIFNNNYTRLSGVHVNGASVHKLLHECGMINYKTSKALLSSKAGCQFIPCKPRGTLSLLYIKRVAKENGLDDVKHPGEVNYHISELVISSKDILEWHKNDEVMNQSWYEVRTRACSAKKGVFFQADSKRRKKSADILTADTLKEACEVVGLRPPSRVPKTRVCPAEYTHIKCGEKVFLRYREVGSWSEIKCNNCYPASMKALYLFNDYLKENGMYFTGQLSMISGTEQVDRRQNVEIKCQCCGGTNKTRSYDKVRYRGFKYCDNENCNSTYSSCDITNQGADYYIDLFRRNNFTNFAQAQKLFPVSVSKILSDNCVDKDIRMYNVVREALGWKVNSSSVEFTEEELSCAFQRAINKGASNITEIFEILPSDMHGYIIKCAENNDKVHHRVLDKLDFKFKQSARIDSVSSAVEFIIKVKAKSWSDISCNYPIATKSIIDMGFKEKVFEYFNWEGLQNYSGKTNKELIEYAFVVFKEKNFTSINELENNSYGLVRNIRERNLIEELCALVGVELSASWKNYTYEETLSYVVENKYISSKDWHSECSGLYKHASKKDWLRDIAKKCGWGVYIGLDGYSYDSIPEVITANLFILSDIKFESHLPIVEFKGVKKGKVFSDFYIEDKIWVEVWAYACNEDASKSIMKNYPEVRKYKEINYKKHGMLLCSIEGGTFYRGSKLRGKKQQSKGLNAFVFHICKQLSNFGIDVKFNNDLVEAVRKSISTETFSNKLLDY